MTVNHSKRVALGGISAALIALCLYAASAFPAGRLGFYFLAAFFPVMLLCEGQRAGALIAAGAAALLVLLLVPNKLPVAAYACFFGWYAVLRDCLVGKRTLFARAVLLIAFDLGVALYCLLATQLLGFDLAAYLSLLPTWAWVAIAIAAQGVFLVIDVFFGLCVEYYKVKIHDRILSK